MNKNFEIGRCPKCNSDDIDYEHMEFTSGTSIYYPAECYKCGTKFKEYYTLEFDCIEIEE